MLLKRIALAMTALSVLALPVSAQTPPRSAVLGVPTTATGTAAPVTVQDGTGQAVPVGTINPTKHTWLPSGLPEVASNAGLLAYKGDAPRLRRRGFRAPGDGGYADYEHVATACSAPDNGAQVTALDGGCWKADLPPAPDVRIWGAVCDRVTDDAAAFNAAAAAISAIDGGDLRMCRGGALIDSADLIIAPNVNLVGGFAIGSVRKGGDYTSAATTPFALILNSARTIRAGVHSTRHGLIILRKGLTPSTDYHSGLANLAAFAGTAITYGDASGNAVEGQTDTDLMILGFNQPIDTNNSTRYRIRDIKLDNNNGIKTLGVYDVANIEHVEGWPFAITGSWANPSRPILGISNNGNGLIRVKVALISSANPATDSPPWINEPIWVAGAIGVPGVNQEWTVAAVSSDANFTYVDFKGSTFSGAWTSGGQLVSWTGRRPGVGLYEDNTSGFEMNDVFFYSYQKAFYYGPNAIGPICNLCSFDDNAGLNDPATIGMDFNGVRGAFSGSFMSSVGRKLIYNSNSSDDTVFTLAPVISPNYNTTITVTQGNLEIIGGNIGGEIHMGSGSQSLRLIGVNEGSGFNLTGDSAADLAKVLKIGGRAGSTFSKPASPFSSYPISGATTLGATQINQIVYATGAPWTLTLPDSNAVPAGATETVVNNSASGIVTIATQNNNALDADGSAGVPAGGRIAFFADGYGNWRTEASSGLPLLSLSAAPSASSIPNGTCRSVYNTGDGSTKHYCNVGGTLKSVTLN